MRVINETKWRTDHLKRLAVSVAARESSLSIEGRKKLKVRFCGRGPRAVRGTSNRPGVVWVKLPPPFAVAYMSLAALVGVVQQLTWGIGAAVGLKNRDMAGLVKYTFGLAEGWDETWGWVRNFPVEPKPEKVVTPEMKNEDDFESRVRAVGIIKKKLDLWHTRLRFAMTKVERWNKELKLAEKRLAEVQQTILLAPAPVEKISNSRKFRKPEPDL